MSRIKDIAFDLVKKYDTRNPYELCDIIGIPVLYEPLGNIKGLFQNTLGMPIIHLNNHFSKEELKPVLAHELRHVLLHKELNVCFLENYTFSVTKKYENEANKFAAELLIYDTLLSEALQDNVYFTYEQMGKYFSVPSEFISYKFSDFNIFK